MTEELYVVKPPLRRKQQRAPYPYQEPPAPDLSPGKEDLMPAFRSASLAVARCLRLAPPSGGRFGVSGLLGAPTNPLKVPESLKSHTAADVRVERATITKVTVMAYRVQWRDLPSSARMKGNAVVRVSSY